MRRVRRWEVKEAERKYIYMDDEGEIRKGRGVGSRRRERRWKEGGYTFGMICS